MSAIVIRRCTLRVTRRGGWCWGEDRRALAERITALVPTLVAKRLAELFGDAAAEEEVAAPLQLDVRLSSASLRDPLALAEAVRRALSIWQPPTVMHSAPATAMVSESESRSAPASLAFDSPEHGTPYAPAGSPLLRLLADWRETGMLASNVAALPEQVAATWFLRLLERAPVALGRAPPAEDLRLVIESLIARLAAPLTAPEARGRARLFVVVELLSTYGALPPRDVLVAALARAIRGAGRSAPADAANPATPVGNRAFRESSPASEKKTVAQTRRHDLSRVERRQWAAREIALHSVLPFLVLGMLHRIGWLPVAAAAFEGLGGEEDGALLAAAMAGRLIAPAAVRRSGHDGVHRTITFFAGLASMPSGRAMTDWGERHSAHLAPIADFAVRTLAEGHDALQPMILLRAGAGDAAPFVLVDCDGGYPVAVVDGPTDCMRILSRFRASPLLVARDAATPALLEALHAADHAWVTDAPPGRGEAGERLPGRAALWAAGSMPLARLRAAASRFSEMEVQARDCCTRLLRGTLPLDRMAFLGAGMGLGLLSWSLWREREPVHPLLALDRLSDLDGVARVDGEVIKIRPAIGRRYLDLRDAGALAQIPGIPWLGGRSVRFIGP